MLSSFLSPLILLNLTSNLFSDNIHYSRINTSCIQYIQWIGSTMSSNITKSIMRLSKEVQYSGTFYNSQGDYYKCINAQSRSYYILYLDPGIQTVGELFYALCLNNSCTGDDVKELVNNLDILLKVTNVIEPKKIQNQSKATWVTYLVLGIILLCVFLTVLMSILHGVPSLQPKIKDNKKLRYLNMFAYQNTRIIFNRPGDIKYMNGVKGICFLLVVIGHEQIQLVKFSSILNIYSTYLIQGKFLTTTILSYLFSIDVFLYISGFMLGYLFPKRYLKQPGLFIFIKTLGNRILRFWPMFLIATLIFWKILPSFGSGPFFWKASPLTEHCANSWWKDLLFFGNLTEMCMSWAWYIEVDVQLCAFCLLFLFIYTRMNRTLSTLLQHVFIVGSIIYLFVVCNKSKFKVWATMEYLISQQCQRYLTNVYYMPATRISVYVFGLAIGIFYFQYQQYKEKLQQRQGPPKKYFIVKYVIKLMESKVNRILIIFFGLCFIFSLILLPSTIPKNEWSQTLHSVYLSMARLFVVVGVLFLTLPLMLGYTNPLQTLLSASILQFISKISFSAYLFHDIYIFWRNLNMPYTTYMNPSFIFYKSVVDIAPILVGGFILAVTIQFPIAGILQELLGRKKGRLKAGQSI